jgi:CRP-like cAMP-binding protein
MRICKYIEGGESITGACRLELVDYTTFRKRVQRNPKYQRRLKEAEETREEFLREYHIANIRKHAPRNLLASLWWLERRFPAHFALKPVHRPEGSTEQPIGDKVDEEQLRRYATLIDDFRRENEAKKAAQTPALPSS